MATEILEQYRAVRVKHILLSETYTELEGIHAWPNGEDVILLVGPTAVGKTGLVERLHANCLKRHIGEMGEDPGYVPSILTKLWSPTPRIAGASAFDWKDAFTRLLLEQNEILVTKKVLPRAHIELDGEFITDTKRLVASELRRAVESFVKNRRVSQVILDEAGHIFVAGSSSNYHLHFDLLKSMAIAFRRPLILSGSYGLLKALELNAQLTRRIQVVHFRRYTRTDLENPGSPYGRAFADSVFTLLERMPVPKEEGLHEAVEFYFMKSLGCIGLLKEWFERALNRVLETGGTVLSRKALEKAARSNKQLLDINREISSGESSVADYEDKKLAEALGFEKTPTLKRISSKQTAEIVSVDVLRKTASNKKRVGTRNPVRDEVGGL